MKRTLAMLALALGGASSPGLAASALDDAAARETAVLYCGARPDPVGALIMAMSVSEERDMTMYQARALIQAKAEQSGADMEASGALLAFCAEASDQSTE